MSEPRVCFDFVATVPRRKAVNDIFCRLTERQIMIIFTDPTASGTLHVNMGRNSTSLLAVIVLVSAALSSGTRPGQLQVNAPPPPKSRKGGYSANQLQLEYPILLNKLIGDECQSGQPANTKALLPGNFIIALAPDPLRTHLALTFGRTMEVIQEGLEDEGYTFVESLMPWDAKAHPESDELSERLKARDYVRATEEYPGLMVFRQKTEPLCVLVVGESPTGGVKKEQFSQAVQQISGNTRPKHVLRILGPTFSGSLHSLAQALHAYCKPTFFPSVSIHSGTVSSANEIDEFVKFSKDLSLNAYFATFQESDRVLIERFVEYARGSAYGSLGYGKESVALVSEDETAYGSYSAGTEDTNQNTKDTIGVRLYFPREISQLRAAYAKEIPTGDTDKAVPRDILPPNGDVPGDDEDSVTEFSPAQTVRSQEGVMQGLAAELRRHKIEFVIVRATDPMDTLFVSRYLRKAYPEGRVVTIGADMLFRREAEDPELHGLLSLSTYSLAPTGNHGFRAYEDGDHVDRVFPSSNETGTYNALRALVTAWVDEASGKGRTDGRAELRAQSKNPSVLPLFQYGRQTEFRATYAEQKAAVDENAPPARLLALGRDGYWPLATLGPYEKEPATRLPVVPSQVARELDPLEAPASWRAVQLVTASLALAFCLMLWRSSVFSHSPTEAKFSPACPDSRTIVILVSGTAFTLILLVLFWSSLHDLDPLGFPSRTLIRWKLSLSLNPTDYLLLLVTVLVAVVTLLELISRATLAKPAPLDPYVSGQSSWKRWWPTVKCSIFAGVFVFAIAGAFLLAHRAEHIDDSQALLVRFATLRATHLTSGLSFIMPIFFFLGAWLWWSGSVVGGYALLDPRRPRLPHGMKDPGLLALGGRIPNDLQRALQPGVLEWGKDLFLLGVIAVPLLIVVGPQHWDHLTLEQPTMARLMAGALALVVLSVVELTQRLWKIWVEVRRLLDALDSLPLRRGFREIKGFSWKPIWRLGAGTMAEFQRLLARQREALTCAINSYDGLQAKKTDLDREWKETFTQSGDARKYDHHWIHGWYARRASQLRLILQFGKYQEEVGSAAGIALEYLAAQWAEQKEEKKRPRNEADLSIRACERFVCLAYINCLLTLLARIRMLIVAIGGMYVLILIGTTQYPFEPRDGVQLLLVGLLTGIIAVVGLVFAQIHRDTTLSHITDTHPGELGGDFWIRMGSFVALPLFTLFTSQFPSVNRLFYSWIRPAIESLNH